jgi:hypothetical protein
MHWPVVESNSKFFLQEQIFVLMIVAEPYGRIRQFMQDVGIFSTTGFVYKTKPFELSQVLASKRRTL